MSYDYNAGNSSGYRPHTTRLILDKPEDWHAWVSYLETSVGVDAWTLVDPDKTKKERLTLPSKPQRPEAPFTAQETANYTAQRIFYQEDLGDYERQRRDLARVTDTMFQSLSAARNLDVAFAPNDPWDKLVALKTRLKPDTNARKLLVERRYHEMVNGPSPRQNVGAWLNDWSDLYQEAKRLDLDEVRGERALRDFLLAIGRVSEVYANGRRTQLELLALTNTAMQAATVAPALAVQIPVPAMEEEVEKFRHHLNYEEFSKARGGKEHSATALAASDSGPTLGGKGRNDRNRDGDRRTHGKDENGNPLPCICLDLHLWMNCPIMNPEMRAPGYVEDPAKKALVVKFQAENETLWLSIERRIKVYNRQQKEKKDKDKENGKDASASRNVGAVAKNVVTFAAALAAGDLKDYLILDCGSDTHLCNASSAHLYTKTRDAAPDEYLGTAGGKAKIESYGYMWTAREDDEGIQELKVDNVVYVPDSLTSLISLSVLEEKGIFFDSGRPCLYSGKDKPHTVAKIYRTGGHYTFSKSGYPLNRPGSTAAVLSSPQSGVNDEEQADKDYFQDAMETQEPKEVGLQENSAENWHNRMAHCSREAISHLQRSSQDAEVEGSASTVPRTAQCETCALSKAHEIVSRDPGHSEPSSKPFARISVDLMEFTPALNGHRWVTHIACMATDFNEAGTHLRKSGCRSFILDAIERVKRRYDGVVIYIRSDNEGSFSNEFIAEIEAMGITFEFTAPDTPAQNGHSERKGKMLVIKGRTMRLGADLPHYLWVWAFVCAVYIANRTPTEKHGWKTPFEMVTGEKPYLSHIRTFGCKAYALKHKIPKTRKLDARAHVGYLVGYDSTNIFLVWIPSKSKVIRCRDVIFDEEDMYDPANAPDVFYFANRAGVQPPYPVTDGLQRAIVELDIQDRQLQEAETVHRWLNEPPKPRVLEQRVLEQQKENPEEGTLVQEPTPSPTPSPAPDDTEDIFEDANEDAYEDNFEGHSGLPNITMRKPKKGSNAAPRANEVTADFDEANILSKKRDRKPPQNAYTVSLASAMKGSVDAYHDGFGALIPGKIYRDEKPPTSATSTVLSLSKDLAEATIYERPEKRLHRDILPVEPKGLKELARHPYCEYFKDAMKREIEGLQRKETWAEEPLDAAQEAGKRVIPTMWVFRYKFDEHGWLVKYKARLVARGDLQQTTQDTYAATLAARLFRLLMALATAFDLETRQYDAVNAFANSPIDETTFCSTPPGWTGSSSVVLRLRQALYGLKQSPALWYAELSGTLAELGLEPVSGVECVCVSEDLIVFFFVDDICVLHSRNRTNTADQFERKLFLKYEMKALGEIEWFLGIRVVRDRCARKLWLSQESYIDKLAAKFHITVDKAKQSPLPVEELSRNTGIASKEEVLHYQQKVGSINFAAVITRADIALAAAKLSEHLTNPSHRHLEMVNRVLGYLLATRSYAICFDGNHSRQDIFFASSDASFADDPLTKHSSQGFGFKLFGGIIDWKANKQRTVTLSSTEAELLAVSQAAREVLWWMRLFESLEFDVGHRITIECDNLQTIRALSSTNPHFATKLRHVDIHNHWLRQEVAAGNIHLEWQESAKTLADGLTKPLPIQSYKRFVTLLGLTPLPEGGGTTEGGHTGGAATARGGGHPL